MSTDETKLGHVICHSSDEDGAPDVGITLGLGGGYALWVGELLNRDGANCGFVLHGPNHIREVAPLPDSTEWDAIAQFIREHVGPALARASGAAASGDVAVTPSDQELMRKLYRLARMQPGATDPHADALQLVARHRLAADQAARTTTTEGGENIQVRAKALFWRKSTDHPQDDGQWVADGIGGRYSAEKQRDGSWLLWWAHDNFIWEACADFAEVKRKAGADWQQRFAERIRRGACIEDGGFVGPALTARIQDAETAPAMPPALASPRLTTPAVASAEVREALDFGRLYFERGFIAAAAWAMTKREGARLDDATIDHAWEHRDECMDEGDILPTALPPTETPDEAILAPLNGLRFSDVVEHFQETGGLEKVGFRDDPDDAGRAGVEAVLAELQRQCGIGAGSVSVDPETGLWCISADLDPAGILAALTSTAGGGR
jgi:hypothetical protein